MTDWPHGGGEMARRIRAYDWATTPLGSIEHWSQARKAVVDLVLASGHAMQLAWGSERTVLYNDAYALMLGARHPSALGMAFHEAWPEIWPEIEPLVNRVFAGETVRFEDLSLVMTRHGYAEDTWWNFSYSPVRDESGAVTALLNVMVDAGAAHRAEHAERERDEANARLQENEARFRALVTAGGNSIYRMSPDWRVMYQLDSRTLASTTAPIENWIEKYIPDEDLPIVLSTVEKAIRTKSLFELEHRVRLADGRVGWVLSRAVPLLGPDGEITEWFGAGSDATARREAVERLRESEERLGLAIEIGELASWDWNLRTGELTWNDRHFLMQGYAVGEVAPSYGAWLARVHPDDRRETLAMIETARARRNTFAHEFRVVHADGSVRWCFAHGRFFYDEAGDALRMIGLMEDITKRKGIEAVLRESEERHAFLLELSDATRSLKDPREIQRAAMEVLGEHLHVDRVQYAEVSSDSYVISDNYVAAGVSRMVGRFPIASFGPPIDAYRRGEAIVFSDIHQKPDISDEERENYLAVKCIAGVGLPLLKAGELACVLAVHQGHPRGWTSAEIDLMRETATRTWDAVERARAEAAQKESEERFRQFAEASAAALWIRNAATLDMEYVSPAITRIYGVEPDAFVGELKRWAALIVPEDRDVALEHIERARHGEPVVHEFRIQRASDQAFRWIRNTDFPLLDQDGQVQRIGGIAEDVTEAKLALEHQGVLLAELQHRVRNIMAVIRSMANRTADGAKDVDAYQSLLEGRLLALARVQTLLTREANAGGSLRNIIENEVNAQAPHGAQFKLVGPDVRLSPKAVEVLTLAVHELATNALKYGAFSTPEGRLSVNWTPLEKRGRAWLALDWTEEGAPPRAPITRRGFGSDLIERRIAYELGGTGKITIDTRGARCHLEFPLKDGESILETDAPIPATIVGGTLDMAGAPDLTGRRVLVVEDDYYLAGDTAAALRGAGAEVLGPCSGEEVALDLIEAETPTHAVVDLNLGGGGPRFEVAQQLKERGVPFILITGYDLDVIPAELEDAVRLQKPVPFRKIVEAVGALRAAAS